MVLLFAILILTGLILLFIIQPNTKLSNIILYSLPLGCILNTLLFYLMGFIKVYYNFYIPIIILAVLFIILLIKNLKYNFKINIKNDLKDMPIIYIVFLLFILYKFIIITNSTTVYFFNFDEFTAYHYKSLQLYYSQDMRYIFRFNSIYALAIGNLSYLYGGISFVNPRLFSGIFYCLISLFIYTKLKDFKVNRYIKALIASFILIGSAENLLYYLSFYNNVIYSCFILFGGYIILHNTFKEYNKAEVIIGIIFLLGAIITRSEGRYHIIGFFIILIMYLFITKNDIRKKILYAFIPIIILFVLFKIGGSLHFDLIYNKMPAELYSEPHDLKNILLNDTSEFIKSAKYQMISKDNATSNYIMFITFGISIIVLFLKSLIRKIDKKNMEMLYFILLFQLIYIGLVYLTELLFMTEHEYIQAASFARYLMMITPFSFIMFGALLYNNTSKIKKNKEIAIIKKNTKILLVIPAYNEGKSINNTVQKIKEYNKKSKKYKLDYIVINDGSKDDTEEILIKKKINHIRLIQNLGIGGAVQTGYKYAYENDYDIAIQFDGDGQHDVNYIDRLIDPIVKGQAHMTIGSRFVDKNISEFKSSLPRRIGIKMISILIQYLTRNKIYDTTSGHRAVNRDLIEYFSNNYPTEYPEPISLVEIINEGYKIKEVPVNMLEREEGTSSIVSWKQYYYMVNVFVSIIIKGMGGRHYDE